MEFVVKEERLVYDSFFKIKRYTVQHELYAGGQSQPFSRELFERGNAASVLMHDPEEDVVVLIEQFRVGAIASENPWVLELVAGMVEEGETPSDVVVREAEEESGAVLKAPEFICDFYNSVGGSSEITSVFYAEVDSRTIAGIHGLESENEDIRVVKLKVEEFYDALQSGNTLTGSLAVAGFWMMANR